MELYCSVGNDGNIILHNPFFQHLKLFEREITEIENGKSRNWPKEEDGKRKHKYAAEFVEFQFSQIIGNLEFLYVVDES